MANKRLASLAAKLAQADIDAAALLPSAGLFYLTGMSLYTSERPLIFVLLKDGKLMAVCPAFEESRIAREAPYATIFTYTDEEGASAGFQRLSGACGRLRALAMEYQAARLLEYLLLKEHCGVERLVDLRLLLAEQRMVKDEVEINSMQQAAQQADLVMGFIEQRLAPGISETTLIAQAEAFVKEQGGKLAFISIIGGERTALPHASPSGRELALGDAVVVDLGCIVAGYCSDITRTFVLGQENGQILHIGRIVEQANALARAAVAPGVSCASIDTVARDYIVQAGYGEYFTHRTGHGLGLEIHEEPYIVAGNARPLAIGHTFTIEPGIYLPRVGGVRIEDDICVTATGAISLTNYPRAVRVVAQDCSR